MEEEFAKRTCNKYVSMLTIKDDHINNHIISLTKSIYMCHVNNI